MKLAPRSAVEINGAELMYNEIEALENAEHLIAEGKIIPCNNVAEEFLALLDGAESVGKAEAHIDTVEQTVLFSINPIHLYYDLAEYYLADVKAIKNKVIRNVVYSCLHLIKKMGFITIDQSYFYDGWREGVENCTEEADEEDEQDEDYMETLRERQSWGDVYDQLSFKLPYHGTLLRTYAKKNNPLAEWCRLCLEYRHFKVKDHLPVEIYNDYGDPLPVEERYIICENEHDDLMADRHEMINMTGNEFGFLDFGDYSLHTADGLVKPMLGTDTKKISKALLFIWGFDIKTLNFFPNVNAHR